MKPRRGTLAVGGFAVSVALTWIGCSEENASPVAPSPTTVASASAGSNWTAPVPSSGQAGNAVESQITVRLDGGFSPSGAPGAGVDGVSPVLSVSTVPGWSPPPVGPTAGPARGATPEGAVPDALKESTRESPFAQASHGSDGAGGDDAQLKASAPEPSSPKGGVEIPEMRPFLTVINAEPDEAFLSAFAEENFEYQFEIYRIVGGSRTVVEPATTVAGGSGTTSRQVTRSLDLDERYEWRARATYGGAYGPWSVDASFSNPGSQAWHAAIAQPGWRNDGGDATGLRSS